MTGVRVEVCYALPNGSHVRDLTVKVGMTVRAAVERSGLLKDFPEIDLNRFGLGIFGCVCDADTVVKSGDRVEIYRPLDADPKEMRRRAAQAAISE